MDCLLSVSQAHHGITLYHDDAALNKARFYHMTLSIGLWGNQIVERQWGRRGTWGQCRLDSSVGMSLICFSLLVKNYEVGALKEFS